VRLGQRERWSGEGQHRMEQRRSRTRERAGSPSLLSFQGVGDGGFRPGHDSRGKTNSGVPKLHLMQQPECRAKDLAGADPFSPQPLTPFSGTFMHVAIFCRSCDACARPRSPYWLPGPSSFGPPPKNKGTTRGSRLSPVPVTPCKKYGYGSQDPWGQTIRQKPLRMALSLTKAPNSSCIIVCLEPITPQGCFRVIRIPLMIL
jgi:hypothetical protein